MRTRKSYAIERYLPQINEHLRTCEKCRELVLEHMQSEVE